MSFLCGVKLFLISFFGIVFTGNTQVLDNRNGEAFTDAPFFNTIFVHANKLKALKGEFQYMRHGEGLRSTDFKYVYNFDKKGRLISTFETRTDGGSLDTSWNRYEYNSRDHLIQHSNSDLDGYQTIQYTRDSLGRILTEEFIREIDSAGVRVRSLTFNKESVKYFDYELQTKSTRYNNYNLPYLDEYYNFNEFGYLVERIQRLKMTGSVYTYTYEYNEKGKLSAIRKSSNKKDGYLEELTFKYDTLGNLVEKHIYKKGVFTTDIQIIYSSKTKLLQSVITREVATDSMMILRFRDYVFFD